jgi:hypothetical protein
MVNKKGQMKIQQMAFMLIAVTLLFALVGLFVIGIMSGGLKKAASELEEENAALLASKIANSPEFSCEGAFRYGETNCVDADKVMMLKNKKDYAGFWGVAEIEIRKIYPSEKAVVCEEENYPECNLIEVYSENTIKGSAKSNFISLCRKENAEGEIYDKCEIAEILVSPEEKI